MCSGSRLIFLMLISYCHKPALHCSLIRAAHVFLIVAPCTVIGNTSYRLQVFKFINEAALNNSGVSYWTSASDRESCNKLFLSDSLWLLKINANLSLPAGVPNDLCRQQGHASAHLPLSLFAVSVSFMAHIHFVLQGGRPESSLLSSVIAR